MGHQPFGRLPGSEHRSAAPCLVHPRGLHPWHDIPTGPRPPDELTAVIEIPTNERNKYELDKTLGVFRLDRVLHSAVHYPGTTASSPAPWVTTAIRWTCSC